MQLRRLRLHNVRSYEEVDVPLLPGTTLIVGDVGSGKTSLLNALEMALFGFVEFDAAYLVRHRASEADVALVLSDLEHTYEVRRRFRRATERHREVFRPVEGSFSTDGQTQSYPPKELRQRTVDLLGFPDNPNPRAHSDLWRWAVYVPQEQMRSILSSPPEERRETVRKALGLERYRIAAENSTLAAREIRRRAMTLRERSRDLDHFEGDLLEAQASLREATDQLDVLERDRSGLAAELSKLREEREVVEQSTRQHAADLQVVEQLDSLSKALASRQVELQALLQTAKNERAELSLRENGLSQEATDASPSADRLDSVLSELARVRHEFLRAEAPVTELAKIELEIQSTERELSESDARNARLVAEQGTYERRIRELLEKGFQREPPAPTSRTLEEITADVENASSKLGRAQASVALALREEAEIEDLLRAGVCPRCHQTVAVESFSRHRVEAHTAVESATSHVSALEASRAGLQSEQGARERFERALVAYRHQETIRSELEAECDARKRQRAEVETHRTKADARLGQLRARESELRPVVSGRESLRAELTRLEQAQKDLHATQERAHRSELELRDVRGKLAALNSGSHRDEAEVTRLVAEANALGKRRREALSRIEAARPIVERLASLVARDRELEIAARDKASLSGARQAEQAEARRREDEATMGLGHREGLRQNVVRMESLAAWLGENFREAVLRIEHQLLAKAQREFEKEFARAFGTLVEDPYLTPRIDPEFSPSVEIDGEWTPAEALSGGERTALALAYRLALGQVVRASQKLSLETLILDEPTDGFSPEQVVRMGELLERLEVPQVIIVSHEVQLAAVADRVYRVTKEAGLSRVELPPTGEVATAPSEAPRSPSPSRPRGPSRKRSRPLEAT